MSSAALAPLTKAMLRSMRDFARPVVRRASEQLADQLEIRQFGDFQGCLFLPHYWAIFVHDGVRRRRARSGAMVFIWFPNPTDDPRLRGGRNPITKRPRKLSPGEFISLLEENARRALAGLPPKMVVTEVRRPTRGFFFFSRGLRRIAVRGAQVHDDAIRFVNAQLRTFGLIGRTRREPPIELSI